MKRWMVLALTVVFGCSGPDSGTLSNPESKTVPPDPVTAESRADPWGLPMMGWFTYFADAASFEPCGGTERFPVAMEADYLAAEQAYLESRSEPGAPLLMTVVGRIADRPPMEGDGLVEVLVIDRFEAVHPDEDCKSIPSADIDAVRAPS